jgi:HAD superfamily phosphoserine phosphatase-like hydrolase
MKTALAIYDMDRTVTRQPTYGAFVFYASWKLAPWRILLSPLMLFTSLLYLVRLVDRGRLKEWNFELMIGRPTATRLAPVIESFADWQVRSNILPGAHTRIAEDKAAGRRLVLATASYRLYSAAIAARLGFDDVIATDMVTHPEGRIVARIDGRNCYGLGKLDMIEAWLQQEGLERDALHVRFYSDHVSDAPVHRWSDEAFAANPHDRLKRLARTEGWEVLDWRDRARATR